MSFRKNIPYKFILFAALFLIADFALENINHQFKLYDFKVYYGAANALSSGKPMYGVLFALGSGYYKYSPLTALLFYPLSILPYYFACVIEYLLTGVALVIVSIIILNLLSTYIFSKSIKSANLILILSTLCIAPHIVRELGLGNVNVLLLLLLCLTLLFIAREKFLLAGILLALVIITKPFFILVLIPLVMRRYFKTLFITAATLLVCVILPALFFGVTTDVAMHSQWLSTMLTHADGFTSSNTIYELIRTNVYSSLSVNFQYVIIVLLLLPYIYMIRTDILNAGNNEKQKMSGLVMEWFILIALMPSLFRTDTEHFLMTLPIIIFILTYLFQYKNIAFSIVFAILIILYAGNMSDLVGMELSAKIRNWGILGISNLLLIAMSIYYYFKQIKDLSVLELELSQY